MIIDFGSKNTVISVGNSVKRFATAIAVDELDERVVAFGDDAAAIQDRAQSRVKVLHPVVRGAVTDLDAARRYLRLVWESLGRWSQVRGGRTRILTSTQLSRLDRNVLAEAVSEASGGQPEFIWNGLASAVYADRDIDCPTAIAVVDLGAETSEVAVFSARRLLRSKVLPLGGSDLTRQIQRGASGAFGADLSWSDSELLKKKIGSAQADPVTNSIETITARDRVSGLPVEIEFSSQDLSAWLRPYLSQLRTCLREAFAGLDPRVASDIYHHRIILTGGGALLSGMQEFVSEAVGVETSLLDKPVVSAVLGASKLNTQGRILAS